MLKKALMQHYGFTHYAVVSSLEGLTHAESLQRPATEGNCANWVLGHIMRSRGEIHKLVGAEPPLSDEETVIYKRGSAALSARSAALNLDAMRAAFETSQATVMAALERMSDQQFAAPKPEDWDSPGGDTVGEQLAALAFHESYHAGQLGLIRRTLGRKGFG